MTCQAPALGLEPGLVRLVEYDDRWPALFVAEQQRIREQCGALRLKLEHIGGTSIAGMCAKPVLDILAGRPPMSPARDYAMAVERVGYEHRGERGVSGREFFCKGEPRTHHLHLVEEDGLLWREYVAFRDYLRAHTDIARQFADLKRTLAARFARDREAYMKAKSVRVEEILRLARADRG
jgi:GrpB-like predicted nucleotidyltransferase (UPF0157 family)